MTQDDEPPKTVPITLSDLAGIIEGEAADMISADGLTEEAADHLRGAAFVRESIASDGQRRDGEGAKVLPFPARRSRPPVETNLFVAATLSVASYAERIATSVIEQTDAEEVAAGIGPTPDLAYTIASTLLEDAEDILAGRALHRRADRILGPRRGVGGRPGPEAA